MPEASWWRRRPDLEGRVLPFSRVDVHNGARFRNTYRCNPLTVNSSRSESTGDHPLRSRYAFLQHETNHDDQHRRGALDAPAESSEATLTTPRPHQPKRAPISKDDRGAFPPSICASIDTTTREPRPTAPNHRSHMSPLHTLRSAALCVTRREGPRAPSVYSATTTVTCWRERGSAKRGIVP